ncbi:hypothetical protein AB0M46_03800 [Dactylosporangium sp. NPDC051485]|uniref:hypothetical protein n=1 Tax=Dactylosporangium sp. NPDC051485 TaxID=3154846 RepID=UPI0034138775
MRLPEENSFHERELRVKAELFMAESSHPGDATGVAAADWLLSRADAERELAGLRSLLGAVKAMHIDSGPDQGLGSARPPGASNPRGADSDSPSGRTPSTTSSPLTLPPPRLP